MHGRLLESRQICDLIVPLHDKNAVEHFSQRGGAHALLGPELAIAIGPLVSQKRKKADCELH